MIELLDDRVAIIPIEDPDRYGMIWIPDTAKKKADNGVIKYRGPEVKDLRVGDHVLFSAYSGQKITITEEGLLVIMREEDVLCVLGEGEELFTLAQVKKAIAHGYRKAKDETRSEVQPLIEEYLATLTTRSLEV